eukprot:CAMPEP_0176416932 /NCGR_PEP_ID=MMETSP0127-20121128/6609_1 /TAXON_ID=938130 /ORGANISM="Platyophrya macrostoma, Strain WH" /LENGTH=697 /DNA_ID=CAMNT_0017797039 /DNA_START=33 /DNA_END=2126 /DNA_ORIENTATION=+
MSLGSVSSRFSAATASSCAALFPTSVEGVQTLLEQAKATALEQLQKVYDAPRTFHRVCAPVDAAAAELSVAASILSVVKNTHTVKAVRDEASASMVALDAFSIDNFSSNKKLFAALKDVKAAWDGNGNAANGIAAAEEDAFYISDSDEYRYWLDEELAAFRRRGLDLPEETFQQVIALQKEVSALSTKFSTNIAEDATEIEVDSLEQLAGVPEPIVKQLTTRQKSEGGGDVIVLKMDYPTYFGVMKNCEVAETRKRMARAFENRAHPQNLAILQDIIQKRHQIAVLLGFPSYSHLDLDSKMAKRPETARAFIDDLIPALQKKWAQELASLKENLHSSVILTADGSIPSYDIAFCMNYAKKTRLNVSETTIQEYFPLTSTVAALFDIYESFFAIRFEKLENAADLWFHEGVSTLVVRDAATSEVLGHVILDLFPRDGKFTHACCHSVIPPIRQSHDGSYSPALSVVIANFPKGTADTPALFLHDDVETFFHEFGHAIHGLMGRSRMPTMAGTRVKRDFVELPSQMLEEWLWDSKILQRVTKHYKTGEALPKELIAAKIASQNAFSGRDSLRQLVFATYALELFGPSASSTVDTSQVFYDIQDRILPGIQFSRDTHFECAFGHLTGYAATYYGYMWSEVFAQDVFEYIRQRDGLLSSTLGKRYRDMILGCGGGKDPSDMLEAFLERKPNANAFFKKIGI